MANDATQTIIKSAGDVYTAPVDTAPPAAASLTTLATLEAAGWIQRGFIHEDGPQWENFEGEKQSFNVWNVQAPARTRTIVAEPLVTVPFVQWDDEVLTFYFPGATIDGPTGDVVVPASAGESSEQALLIVVEDGSESFGFWAARTSARPGGTLEFPGDDFAQLVVAFDILVPEDDSDGMYRWIGLPEGES